MFKKTVTYVDYNGVERKEDFYFNFSKAELAEMQIGTTGGYTEMIQKIIDAKDYSSLIKLFKELVLNSYGVKSEDGKRFIKSKELSEAFSQTEAYSQIFMELATDDTAAAEFVNNVVPADLAKKVAETKMLEDQNKILTDKN